MLRIQGISGMTSGTCGVYRARDWSAQAAAHISTQARPLLLACTGLSHSEDPGSPIPAPVRAKAVRRERANRAQYFHSTEYCPAMRNKAILPFATTWMELEGITLSEISQR